MIKVNAKNYKSVTKDVDFSKLSKSLQDAHKEFDDFLEFYNDDKEIKKMLDNHFKALEKELNKGTKTTRKTLKPKEDKYRVSLNEGSYQFDQYFSSSSLKVTQQSAIKKMQKQIEHRPSDQSIWATIDEKIGGSWKEIDRIKYKVKGEAAPMPKTTKKSASKAKAKPKTSSKKASPKKATRKANEVSVMPIEIRIMKRYLGMDGKKVTERQVTLFYRMIQRAATEGTVRKTSKYALFIKAIGKDLAATYKEMEDTAVFEIPASLKKRTQAVVDSYGITPAIALVKRFINLYGGITTDKAQRLLKSIQNAKKNGKVKSSDKAYKKIQEIESHLENYLQSDKLIITDIQLNGLRGIANMGK